MCTHCRLTNEKAYFARNSVLVGTRHTGQYVKMTTENVGRQKIFSNHCSHRSTNNELHKRFTAVNNIVHPHDNVTSSTATVMLSCNVGQLSRGMSGRRQLRSADTRILDVPWTRTAIGARNFAVAGPRVWNSLPPELRTLNCSVGTFVQRLKTFLFSCQRV